jgi:hypothetical protein
MDMQARHWTSGPPFSRTGCKKVRSSHGDMDDPWMLWMLQQERFSWENEKVLLTLKKDSV